MAQRAQSAVQQDEWVDVPSSGQDDEWVDVTPAVEPQKPTQPTALSRFGEVTGISSLPQLGKSLWESPLATVNEMIGVPREKDPRLQANLFSPSTWHRFLDPEEWKAAYETTTGLVGAALHPIRTAQEITGGRQFGEDIEAGRYGAAAGDVAGGLFNVFSPKLIKEAHPIQRTRQALGSVRDTIRPPTVQRASDLFERGVGSTMGADPEATFHQDFRRAAKYIAPETKQYPLPGGRGRDVKVPTGPSGQMSPSYRPGGAVQSANVAHNAKLNLWRNYVDPVMEQFGDVQRPGSTLSEAVRNSVTGYDLQFNPGVARKTLEFADALDRPMTIRQMNEFVKQMNAEPGVTRFYNLDADGQAAVLKVNPLVRSQITVVEAARKQILDALEDVGGEQFRNQFASIKSDYGAIGNIEDYARKAKIPAPAGLPTRVMNTVRGVMGMRGPSLYLSGIPETLGHLNDPNRLLSKSFNVLGRTGLEPPMLEANNLGRLPPLLPPPRVMPQSPMGTEPGPADSGPFYQPGEPVPSWSTWAQPQGPMWPSRKIVAGTQSPLSPVPTDMVPVTPTPENQLGLFGQTPTPVTPMEWSRARVMGLDLRVQELLDQLSDPNVSSVEKAAIRQKLSFIPSTRVKGQ